MSRPILQELDSHVNDLTCGIYALQQVARYANFRQGGCPEADQVQHAVEWIADRLLEQTNRVGDLVDDALHPTRARTP
jgi:hypothetical protein